MRSVPMVSSLVLVACLAFGCSSAAPSDPTPTSSVTGAVSATSLKSMSAVTRYGEFFPTTGGTPKGLRVLVSDRPNTCSVLHFVSSTNLDLRIRGESVALGTFPIVDTNAKTAADGKPKPT